MRCDEPAAATHCWTAHELVVGDVSILVFAVTIPSHPSYCRSRNSYLILSYVRTRDGLGWALLLVLVLLVLVLVPLLAVVLAVGVLVLVLVRHLWCYTTPAQPTATSRRARHASCCCATVVTTTVLYYERVTAPH